MSSDTCGCYQWTWNNLQITVVMFTSKANISSFQYITAEQIMLVSPFEPFPFKSVSPVLSLVVQCRSAGFINMWESDISVCDADNSFEARDQLITGPTGRCIEGGFVPFAFALFTATQN